MRLTFKITIFFIGGICLVMAWHGYTRLERERELLETQMRRHHYAIAQPLAVMVGESWDELGEVYAYSLVESSNEADDRVRIRWVWTESESPERVRPEAPDGTGAQLARGMAVSWIDSDQIGAGRLFTYVPVVLDEERIGALELSESFERQEAYLADTRRRIIETTLLILVLSAALAWATGLAFIARPIEAMIGRARGIGSGDLKTTLELRGHGELTELAREMNWMSHQLLTTRQKLKEESKARLAALRQLRHADRLKTVGTLSAGLAHELGTPLNVISMRAKMIEDREVTGEAIEKNASIITTQTERISKIIRKLMDFARVRSLEAEQIEVRAVVDEARQLIAPMAEKKGVTIAFEEGSQPLVAEIDADQFVQVMTNLLVNAMHACEEAGAGHIDISVEVVERIHPKDDDERLRPYAAISVADDGVGIDAEELEVIFEPFYTTKPVGEGSGLGLSVSYGIIGEHGGWIEVESTPGEGTVFVVILPFVEQSAHAQRVAQPEEE